MFGLFEEIGPFRVRQVKSEDGNSSRFEVSERRHSWTSEMNVLFVDQPTGNGFSFNANNQTGKYKDRQSALSA